MHTEDKLKMGMRMLFKIKGLWIIVAVLAVLAGMNTGALAEEPADQEGDKGYLTIFYPIKSTILYSEITGTVRTMTCDMGQAFKKGTVLVTLDSVYPAAEAEKARATFLYAGETLRSKKKLSDQKSISRLEYAKAEAEYSISKANLSIAAKRLAACTIKAPYSGRVVKLLVHENEYVPEGQPMMEILDDSRIQVKFHLPAPLYSTVLVGESYEVTVRDIATSFECKITHISPVMESNTNSFQVFAEIDNSKNRIRSGMTGYIRIEPRNPTTGM